MVSFDLLDAVLWLPLMVLGGAACCFCGINRVFSVFVRFMVWFAFVFACFGLYLVVVCFLRWVCFVLLGCYLVLLLVVMVCVLI